ncbi:MAG: cysteine peptidase family C39 domain-containing protein [Candidatus Paceibacterota bacterium]|jgi:ABC-type bacteriocin/lantibiotic exporter with double-glycine peptidase domain
MMWKKKKKLNTVNRDEQKIKVEPFQQSMGLCGPASLKILLSYFGKNHTEEQLANVACSISGMGRGEGTEHEGMIQAIKEIGGFVYVKENGSIEELEYFIREEKLPVIIGWFDENDDHYSVVVNVTDKNIIIVDPASEEPERWINKEIFPRIWFDFVGKDDKTVSWNWYMVVTFDKKKFKVKGGYYY